MAITLNGTTGISSPGGDTSTSLATTNLSYTGTLTGGTGVIAIGTNQIYKDASGNVGIGTSSPTAKLTVSDGDLRLTQTVGGDASGVNSYSLYFKTPSGDLAQLFATSEGGGGPSGFGGALRFYTKTNNSTLSERARIDSSGNLLVGTTSVSPSNSNSLYIQPSAGFIGYQHANGTASGTGYSGYYYNGTTIGSVTQNGTTSVNFNGNSVPPSDIRLKENLYLAPSALPVLEKLQIKSFDWKGDGNHQTYGVIAQEVLEVFPEFVSVPDESDKMLGINQSAMVPFLVKAIQELTTRLEALEAQ